ncbi:MAG: class I SAM-dependent methyltransferase [Spirochaetes bacterium]|nr:class I SAM-dependent methyltransferase [Spirochaetota bacterium]
MNRRVCPWWVGYFLASPFRRLAHKPERILAQYVDASYRVLDIGCGMGFFSIPMAKTVGRSGRVYSLDLQERMIEELERRAEKAGVRGSIETRLCGDDSLGIDDLEGRLDFALAFYVIHEMPDRGALFAQVHRALKRGRKLLVVEPNGHVSKRAFEETIREATAYGFEVMERPLVPRSRACALTKK